MLSINCTLSAGWGAFRLGEHDVDLFVRHLIHSISLTLWPECGGPLNRLTAAEIKVRH